MTGEHREVFGTAHVVRIAGPFARVEQAWSEARRVVDGVTDGETPLEIIGDFVIPPADVARFTALHIPGLGAVR